MVLWLLMMTWSGSWLSFYTTLLSTSIFHPIKGRFYYTEDEKGLTFLSNEFNPYRETCSRFVQAQKTFPTPIDQQKDTGSFSSAFIFCTYTLSLENSKMSLEHLYQVLV